MWESWKNLCALGITAALLAFNPWIISGTAKIVYGGAIMVTRVFFGAIKAGSQAEFKDISRPLPQKGQEDLEVLKIKREILEIQNGKNPIIQEPIEKPIDPRIKKLKEKLLKIKLNSSRELTYEEYRERKHRGTIL